MDRQLTRKERAMEFKKFEDIIDFAIEKEREAVSFYEEAAEAQTAVDSKKMFNEFADEERKHVSMLQNIGEADVSGYDFEWIPDIKRSNFLVDIPYEKNMPYKDMLLLAIKREEKALALYNEMLKTAEKPEFKNVFKMLCQEEANHKLKLETIYDDYMAEMGD
jgi:rubrerythrin